MTNALDAEEIADRRKREHDEAERARFLFALSKLCDIYEFRELAWALLGRSLYFDASFTGEALTTAFREGKRNLGAEFFADLLTARPDIYTVMRNEALARDEQASDEPTGD